MAAETPQQEKVAFTVRRLRPEDAEAVLAIAERSPAAAAWSKEGYRKLSEQSGTLGLVLEEAGTVVGFLVARSFGPDAEILNVAVSPDKRRHGYANALLVAAFQQFTSQGVRTIYLELRQSNTGALAFYARHGFEKSGVRRGYYTNPNEDAILMHKRLVG